MSEELLQEIEQKLLQWTILKDKIRRSDNKNSLYIFNNFVYWAHLGINIGSEQEEDRPVLIVRSTKESSICHIIPLTLERLSDDIPYHIDLSDGIGTALIEQIRTISKDRIYGKKFVKQRHATINDDDRNAINIQLKYLYTLKPLFNKQINKMC